MATPNLANVATIKPFTKVGAITTSDVYAFQVPAESCYKLELLFADTRIESVSSKYKGVVSIAIVAPGGTTRL